MYATFNHARSLCITFHECNTLWSQPTFVCYFNVSLLVCVFSLYYRALDNLFAHHTLIFIAIPFEAAEKSAMVTLVITAYGGHIGFLEGILPTRRMLTDRICKEFLCAMKQYRPNGVDQCTTRAV